jgi:hypothetical protein
MAGVAEKPGSGGWQQSRFVLEQSRPNPVVNRTKISYEIERPQRALLAVCDPAGKLVETLLDGNQPAGPGTVPWDRTDDAADRLPAASTSAGSRQTARASHASSRLDSPQGQPLPGAGASPPFASIRVQPRVASRLPSQQGPRSTMADRATLPVLCW